MSFVAYGPASDACKPFEDMEMTYTVEISVDNLSTNIESEIVLV